MQSALRLSLIPLASVRLRRQWPLALAQMIGLGASVGLAMTVPLVQATASQAGLEQVVASLGSKRFVTIEQLSVSDQQTYDTFQRETTRKTSQAVGAKLRPEARFVDGPKQRPFQLNGKQFSLDESDPTPNIASWEGLASHIRVVQGALPPDGKQGAVYPVAFSTQGARDLTVKVGDTICFPLLTVQKPWCAQIAALYEPKDANDPYWGGSLPQHSLMLGQAAYWQLVGESTAAASARRLTPFAGTAAQAWAPDISSLHDRDIAAFAGQLNALRGYFAVQRDGLFLTGLDTGVKAFEGRYLVASFTIQMIAAALLLVALYSLSFVGSHFFDSQARPVAVLRGRGWSRRRLWALLMTQVAVLAVVAVPLGVLAAYGLSVLIGRITFGGAAPQLHTADLVAMVPFAAASVVGALGVLGLQAAAASRRGVLDLRRARSRSDAKPFWQWRGADLALGALAVPLLAEVQLRGSSQLRAASAAAQTDVVGLLLPALALLMLAVAALRLLPLTGRAVRLASRGLAADFATWQLMRQPVQSARVALLLSTTVAIGIFSAIYSATDHRNTVDRAGYAAGADMRAIFSGFNTLPPNVDQALPTVPDVAVASTTYRAAVTPGGSNLDAIVLAIDTGTFRQVAWTRDDLAAEPLDLLTERLVQDDPDGVRLEGRPNALKLWVMSSGLPDATLSADVTDADGRHCTCSFGDLGFSDARTLSAAISFTQPPSYPLRLRSLLIKTAGVNQSAGEIAIDGLTATAPDQPAQVVESFEQHDGWWQEVLGAAGADDDLQASSRHPREGRPTTTIGVHLTPGTPLYIRPAPSGGAVPALVSSQTLDKLGVGLHQAFPMHVDEVVVKVSAVGVVDYFPTLYPGRDDFLIMPRDTLLARLGHEHYSLAWPNEAWLKLDGSRSAAEGALRKSVGLIDVSDRSAIQATSLADPLRLALQATLAIGFGAALAMAVVGFALHFLVAARGRLSEYAILQANGLPHRLVMRSVLAEQAAMLLYGLVVGAALALVMAWAILPSVQVSDALPDLVPPTVLTVDPAAILTVLIGVAAVAMAAGQVASRLGGRLRLRDELRRLG